MDKTIKRNIRKTIEEAIIGLTTESRQSIIEYCVSDAIKSFIIQETNKIQPYRNVKRVWDSKTQKYKDAGQAVKGQEDFSDEAYMERASVDKDTFDKINALKKKYPKNKLKVPRSIQWFDDPNKNGRYDTSLPAGRKLIKDFQRTLTNKQREKTGTDRFNLKDLGYPNVSDEPDNIDAVNYGALKYSVEKYGKIDNTQLGEVDNSVRGEVFSYGNRKLPASTMIFNLTTAKKCPAKMFCDIKDECYANAGESAFKDTFLRNLRNRIMLEHISLKDFLKLIELYIEYAPMRIKNIRISEDGDFKNINYVRLADKIAGHLNAKYGIKTTIYTAMPFDFGQYKNLIVNASNKRVKNPTRYFLARKADKLKELGIDFSGEGIQYNDKVGYYFTCPCNCRLCGFCYRTKEENGEPEEPITVFEKLRSPKNNKNKR